MTDKLTKTFFETFGIEPRYEDACTVEDKYWNNEEFANEYGTFDQYMNCKCGDQENCTTECSCAYQKEIYPEITDRILLELICIIGSIYICTQDKEDLKRHILVQCMNYSRDIKHQVRTLFKEVQE